MLPLSENQLCNSLELLRPEIMLETLYAAYQFTLDEMELSDGGRLLPDDISRRLDIVGQWELGRRLAAYSTVKMPPSSEVTNQTVATLASAVTYTVNVSQNS